MCINYTNVYILIKSGFHFKLVTVKNKDKTYKNLTKVRWKINLARRGSSAEIYAPDLNELFAIP